MSNLLSRRAFIDSACWTGVAASVGPKMAFAQIPTSKRLLFVNLRGAMDGLFAFPPTGDPAYQGLRGDFAFDASAVTQLDGVFSLCPGFANLKQYYDLGELLPVHAVGLPYTTRSHFDGQAVLGSGLDEPRTRENGWLNRALNYVYGSNKTGLTIGTRVPPVFHGPAPVVNWRLGSNSTADGLYKESLDELFLNDPILSNPYTAAQTFEAQRALVTPGSDRRGLALFETYFKAIADVMNLEQGARVAQVEFSGWDTHANQGMAGGTLDLRLEALANAMIAFRNTLNPGIWRDTVIVVMTEFGRTARYNNSNGTDHGQGGMMILFGGSVNGGRVLTDWPGVANAQLNVNRELRATMDTRRILKGVMAELFDISQTRLDNFVFPNSANASRLMGLVRN